MLTIKRFLDQLAARNYTWFITVSGSIRTVSIETQGGSYACPIVALNGQVAEDNPNYTSFRNTDYPNIAKVMGLTQEDADAIVVAADFDEKMLISQKKCAEQNENRVKSIRRAIRIRRQMVKALSISTKR
jgi:hypothetical protein